MIKKLSGKIQYNTENKGYKIAIVKSNYHDSLTAKLEKACREKLIQSGVWKENIKTFDVPGSWEIPLIVKKLAVSKKFDGIVAFGIILKGETYHFEAIANEVSRSLMDIVLSYMIPVTFEVLAVYSLDQAEKRSSGEYNKGIEAAETVLKTIKALQI